MTLAPKCPSFINHGTHIMKLSLLDLVTLATVVLFFAFAGRSLYIFIGTLL